MTVSLECIIQDLFSNIQMWKISTLQTSFYYNCFSILWCIFHIILFDDKEAGLGGAESPIKENGIGFVVPDEEEEWVVCTEFNGWEFNSITHLTPTTSCSLGTFFIYFHKGLVENIGQK